MAAVAEIDVQAFTARVGHDAAQCQGVRRNPAFWRAIGEDTVVFPTGEQQFLPIQAMTGFRSKISQLL